MAKDEKVHCLLLLFFDGVFFPGFPAKGRRNDSWSGRRGSIGVIIQKNVLKAINVKIKRKRRAIFASVGVGCKGDKIISAFLRPPLLALWSG